MGLWCLKLTVPSKLNFRSFTGLGASEEKGRITGQNPEWVRSQECDLPQCQATQGCDHRFPPKSAASNQSHKPPRCSRRPC